VSTAYALGGVTAVLEYLLNNGLGVPAVTGATGQTVLVSAQPPDLIDLTVTHAKPQINLFLHQVSPNAAWRNRGLSSRDAGGERLTNPPLALDLHYFLTAYGTADLEAEVLLGYALTVLHETPVLARDVIRAALNGAGPSTPSAAYQMPLKSVGLADQIEQLKISPFPLNTEEMSRFWTAMQAHYRPTFSFQVTVALIKAQRPAAAPLPVLTRAVAAQTGLTPAAPRLSAVTPPLSQTGALIGDTVALAGNAIADPAPKIHLANAKFGIDETVAATGASTNTSVSFKLPATLPSDPTRSWPAGVYQVSVTLLSGQPKQVATNAMSLVIAPNITTALPASFASAGGTVTINLACAPPVLQEQSCSLILGGTEVAANALTAAASSNLTFVATVPKGAYLARLRVDGIDSFILDFAAAPPVFLNKTITVT
jgi:Pvc16 N-terminal domain